MPDTVIIVRFPQFGDASVLQLDRLPLPSPEEGEVRKGDWHESRRCHVFEKENA